MEALCGIDADGTPGAAKRTADFYVSPSGDVIPGECESYIGENQILSQIEDQTLRSVVGQMYSKDSVIGTGSMPELIRFSEQNGLNLISESQYVRVERMYACLTKQAYIGALSSSEKEVLKTIMAAWN